MRMFLRMKCENFVLAAEIPCEWRFATKFASDCECDGVVHSAHNLHFDELHSWLCKQFTTKSFSKSVVSKGHVIVLLVGPPGQLELGSRECNRYPDHAENSLMLTVQNLMYSKERRCL